MWMLPLSLHVNQKSDYDDDIVFNIYVFVFIVCSALTVGYLGMTATNQAL